MQMNDERILTKLKNLSVDRNPNRYTNGKAPHKPLLLISLMILDKHSEIDLEDISPDYYLKQTWDDLWSVLDYPSPGTITQPLYHMRSEGFWVLEFKDQYRTTSSLNSFKDQALRIALTDDLLKLIREEDTRNRMINTLINDGGYFSDDEAQRLRQRVEELDTSFVYEKAIENEVLKTFRSDWSPDSVQSKVTLTAGKRDPAFRRLVLSAYDETCAVCGMRLQTSSGISVLDAAHILPFNRFFNDDVRNGISMCKTHHWLFDRGILSLDDRYRVLVSKDVEDEIPHGVVKDHQRQEILLPEDNTCHPAVQALEWHRENVFR